MSTVGDEEVPERDGVNGFRRLGVLAGACLALSAPAAAQSPDPDAAPPPSPDPAPTKTQPAKAAPKPAATATATTPQPTPTPENESPPVSGAVKTVTRHTSAPRRTHRPKRHKPAAKPVAPTLPHIRPAQLLAAPSDGDDRARRLAIGAIALLLLALASATLVAVAARFEQRRMMR